MPLEIRGAHFLIRSAQLVRKARLGENSAVKCKRAAFTLCVHAVSRCRCGRRLRYRRSAASGRSAAPALRVERRPDATAGAATNLWPPPPCRRPPSTTTTTTTRRLRPSTPPRRRPAAVPQVSKSVSDKCVAVRKVATPLRELTCHTGSHSVTCHPAEVTFSRPYPSRSWYSIK